MKSPNIAKQLECHGFICQSPEDAIVIAATLYQSLMACMSNSQVRESQKFMIVVVLKLIIKILSLTSRICEPESPKIGTE
jgi:hypothetical protein